MKPIYSILFLLFFYINSMAQSNPMITSRVLTPLCNCNGSIEYTYSGFSGTISGSYKVGTKYIRLNLPSNGKDTITGLCKSIIDLYVFSPSSGTIYKTDTFTDIFTTSLNITNPVCPATTGTINFTITGGTPPITYECINLNTGTVVGTSNSLTLPKGIYHIYAIDGNGCKTKISNRDSNKLVTDTLYISDNSSGYPYVSSTIASCTNGTAKVDSVIGSNAIPPYTYQWSNGATGNTITNLITGIYAVTVTGANGCKSTNEYIYIEQDPVINVHLTNTPATCIQNDGSIIGFGAGGQNPYTYLWSNGQTSQTISNLAGGGQTYGLTVTDANGCIGKNSTQLVSSTPITATYVATPSSCISPTGSATVSFQGGVAPYNVVWYTYPAQTGVTASNLSPGTYSFKITDANGCIRTGKAIVPPISTISVGQNLIAPICPSTNGSISVFASGSAPPFTYKWNNGATTSNINTPNLGLFSVTITDNNSCKLVKSFFQSSEPGFSTGHNTTPVSCIYNKDGGLSISVYGGKAPYLYSINGQNWVSTNTFSNLGVGTQSYSVKDDNGCVVNETFCISNANTTNSCYCTIKGNVYYDANSNCAKDISENGIPNIMMYLKGFGYTNTDESGYYEFQVPTGNYTLSQQVQTLYPLSSCQSNRVAVNVNAAANCTQTFDFADSLVPQHDLFINTFTQGSAIVPGFSYTQKVLTKNMGNVVEATPKINYKHDNQLTLNSVSSTLTNLTTNVTQSATYPSLNPGSFINSELNYQVPTNIPIGTEVLFKDTITKALPLSTEWLNDLTPWDNVNYYTKTVVSSFDPNSKEVMPQGKGPEGYIPDTTKELVYTINFQNLGTYFARNVVLVDTLSSNVKRETLIPIASSHNYKIFMNEDGVIKFNFNDIFLPEEKTGGEASKGFVMYKIKLKDGLKPGDKIENFADIYFDFNAPVRTNTAVNTILKSTDTIADSSGHSSIQTQSKKVELTIYPNPAVESFSIILNSHQANQNAEMTIHDLQGKMIYQWHGKLPAGQVSKKFETQSLPDGLYLVNFKTENQTLQEKLEVRH